MTRARLTPFRRVRASSCPPREHSRSPCVIRDGASPEMGRGVRPPGCIPPPPMLRGVRVFWRDTARVAGPRSHPFAYNILRFGRTPRPQSLPFACSILRFGRSPGHLVDARHPVQGPGLTQQKHLKYHSRTHTPHFVGSARIVGFYPIATDPRYGVLQHIFARMSSVSTQHTGGNLSRSGAQDDREHGISPYAVGGKTFSLVP